MDLQPFDYLTSAEFLPGYQPEEKALVYGLTGGIPKYLAMFRDEMSVDQNIIFLFFSPSGYFYEEPKNLLRQEFRDVPALVPVCVQGYQHDHQSRKMERQ